MSAMRFAHLSDHVERSGMQHLEIFNRREILASMLIPYLFSPVHGDSVVCCRLHREGIILCSKGRFHEAMIALDMGIFRERKDSVKKILLLAKVSNSGVS